MQRDSYAFMANTWSFILVLTSLVAATSGQFASPGSTHILRSESPDDGAMAIGSQGHMTSAELYAAPVQAHEPDLHKPDRTKPIVLHTEEDSGEDLACGEMCTWNVRVSTAQASQAGNLKYKTMQLKGCKEEKQFHFDGCSTFGDEASFCMNAKKALSGVRVLKDSRNQIVGYGSCCTEGQTDSVVETSVAFCGVPSQASQVNLVNVAPVAPVPVANSTVAAAVVDATKEGSGPFGSATSTWQGVLILAKQYSFAGLMGACCAMSLVAIIASTRLMYLHFMTGMHLTGGLYVPHPSLSYMPHPAAATYIGMVWTVPLFAMTGLAGLMLPELAPVTQFLQALLAASTLRKMPDMFLQAAGGRLQLQRSMQSLCEMDRVDTFTQLPFCCLRGLVPSKKPEMGDIDELHWGVFLLCAALPVLSFVEMVCTLEATLTRPYLNVITAAAPSVAMFVRVMEVMFIAFGMTALQGLGLLIHKLRPSQAEKMNISGKQLYCLTFLLGLRLLPIMFHVGQCFYSVNTSADIHNENNARSGFVCFTSLICAVLALRAFPTDESHYPMLLPNATQAGALKPVLDEVKFCPFCGSGDLEIESHEASGNSDMAACPRCCARHVPLHLVIQRGGSVKASAASAKALVESLQSDLAEASGMCLKPEAAAMEN